MKFRMPCSDPHNMMGERVDPTLPLEKQVYVLYSSFVMTVYCVLCYLWFGFYCSVYTVKLNA